MIAISLVRFHSTGVLMDPEESSHMKKQGEKNRHLPPVPVAVGI